MKAGYWRARSNLSLRLCGSIVAASAAAYSPAAFAQCVAPNPAAPNNVVCSGTNTTPQTVTSTAPDVTTAPGFSVTASGTGLGITAAAGGASYTDANASSLTSGTIALQVDVSGTGPLRVDVNGAIRGGSDGILTNNFGSGATNVVTRGAVTATDADAITLLNGGDATDVSLRTEGAVYGQHYGITILRFGAGSGVGTFNLTALGDVVGEFRDGIDAVTGAGASVMNVSVNNVTGGLYGMLLANSGTGATTVIATGTVIGQGLGSRQAGIYIENAAPTTDLTLRAATVAGGMYGIDVRQNGTGRTDIVAAGPVTSHRFGIAGINVLIGANGGDVSVQVAQVSGLSGMAVTNQGRGSTTVIATGPVQALGAGTGLVAYNPGANTTDLTVTTSGIVTGGNTGIFASNLGTGTTRVTAGAAVTAQIGPGIDARGVGASGDLFVTATDTSGDYGIRATSEGRGRTTIVSTGLAAGVQDGIRATAQPSSVAPAQPATAGAIAVTANNATGANSGIAIDNRGTVGASIQVNGTVQGGVAAIYATSTPTLGLAIVNNGTLRNASGASASQAIFATGGPVSIVNNGTLLGTLNLAGAGGDDSVVNNGLFDSIGGTSNFGAGSDRLTNAATGTIRAGFGNAAETTTFSDLELLSNAGMITMRDGAAGDRITTSGAAVFAAGSQLAIDFGGGAVDLLTAGGALTIQPGAALTVNQVGPMALGERYVFLSAAGGITGSFAFEPRFQSAFVGLQVGYTATTAYLEYAQLRALAAAGLTGNQRAVAAGLDSLPATNALRNATLLLPTDAEARAAFDNLSGEIHPDTRTAMIEDSRLLRNAVLRRLGARESGGIWGQLTGNWGETDRTADAARLRRQASGALLGVDVDVADGIGLGIVGGYLDDSIRVSDRASSGAIRSFQITAYLGGSAGNFQFDAGGGYAHVEIATRRQVGFPGYAGGRLSADYNGSMWHGFGSLGYRVPLGGGHVEPFAGIAVLRAETDGFAERGAPAAALTVAPGHDNATLSTAGLRFRTPAVARLSFDGELGWAHGFGERTPVNRHAFASGAAFEVIGVSRFRNSAYANIRAAYRITDSVRLDLSYDGALGSAGQDNGVRGGIAIAF
ncbi:autotransporter domain-containing protein [Sphingomonas sp. R-74633]|uniref:autotransporter outer membrane beta-barrel domain-containing protein n=1 Tax=Sphingomonas sp. R-74633 TaxID=2751188 RepID=UPI0015D43DBD|nr:autotransporter domain-containing protein [Sphingomonas sp. R-74633]NYT39788.1 autotransporter domain-containing protein [Sphingomonas sp. R-74633]